MIKGKTGCLLGKFVYHADGGHGDIWAVVRGYFGKLERERGVPVQLPYRELDEDGVPYSKNSEGVCFLDGCSLFFGPCSAGTGAFSVDGRSVRFTDLYIYENGLRVFVVITDEDGNRISNEGLFEVFVED